MSTDVAPAHDDTVPGGHGALRVRTWPDDAAVRLVVLAHGYGEHIGRYEHVAARLVEDGAHVVGVDHLGHGRSEGERVLVEDYDDVVDDLHAVVERARSEHPGLPLVLLGHSMGGMIAARYAQRYGDELVGLVLSGPVLGSWTAATSALELPEIPDAPLDPSTLSRDPAVGEAYEADELVWHGPFKRPTLEALAAGLQVINEGPQLGALPTLWIHGAEDRLVPIGETRAGIEALGFTDLETHIHEGARHEVLNETDRGQVLDEIAAFLARVAPGA